MFAYFCYGIWLSNVSTAEDTRVNVSQYCLIDWIDSKLILMQLISV